VSRPAARPLYQEHGRSYASAIVLFLALVGGFVVDLGLGGARPHLIGWLLALVIVVGADLIAIRAARSLRSLTVTGAELRVGEDAIGRDQILGFDRDVDGSAPILGRSAAYGLPRGTRGLALRLADGRTVVVAARRPERLSTALQLTAQQPLVRAVEPEDRAVLAEIEQRAQTLFRVAGLQLPVEWSSLAPLHEALAVLVSGRPAEGFIRIGSVDAMANIELMGVIPGRLRNGVGTALVEAACAWSRRHRYRAICVIAYAEVGWSAPFFASCGFAATDQIGPEMAELRDWERAIGLDRLGPRIVMRREL
jgi:GNAT superfamily N-acetyltransferase